MGVIRSFFNPEEFSNEELKALNKSVEHIEKSFKDNHLDQVTIYFHHVLAEVNENKSKLKQEEPNKFNVTDYKLLDDLEKRLLHIQKNLF